MERKRREIKERVATQYSKIKNEKAARSIKVLHGIVPTARNHSYESASKVLSINPEYYFFSFIKLPPFFFDRAIHNE